MIRILAGLRGARRLSRSRARGRLLPVPAPRCSRPPPLPGDPRRRRRRREEGAFVARARPRPFPPRPASAPLEAAAQEGCLRSSVEEQVGRCCSRCKVGPRRSSCWTGRAGRAPARTPPCPGGGWQASAQAAHAPAHRARGRGLPLVSGGCVLLRSSRRLPLWCAGPPRRPHPSPWACQARATSGPPGQSRSAPRLAAARSGTRPGAESTGGSLPRRRRCCLLAASARNALLLQ